MMIKLLHFADAHIDITNYGRHDPQSGLPLRVIDFLKSLDVIVDAAIDEHVDLVLFAGDAYKDRNPAPTFQREWGRRMMRLSRAQIPTLLLVGNHDLSPALGRAHALEAYDTLDVPHVTVIDRPCLLKPEQLAGLPIQVMGIPWISRSGLIAAKGLGTGDMSAVYEQIEAYLTEKVQEWFEQVDPTIPLVLTAHASIQGAQYGAERSVMLGGDLVLSGSLVKDPRFDYVALGHIHHAQNLNENSHPPVIYPGSTERVDFGECNDEKYYVIAHIERGKTLVDWRQLNTIRPMIDCYCRIVSQDNITDQILSVLPEKVKLPGAIVRLVLEYPRDWEGMIDESYIRQYTSETFELHLARKPQSDIRIRIPEDQTIGSLTPLELLEIYWKANHLESGEIDSLKELARGIISESDKG